jgi:hypothetical protein
MYPKKLNSHLNLNLYGTGFDELFHDAVLLGSVSVEGSSIVGEPLTLMCSVTRVNNATGNLVVQWIGPDGTQLISNGSVTVGLPIASGATTTLSVRFSALYTSNAGQYTCQGELVSNDLMYTVLTLQDITARGKSSPRNFLKGWR